MKNNKLIPIILVSLSCLLFIVAIVLLLNMNHFEFNNKTGNKEVNNNQVKEENNDVSDNNQSNENIVHDNSNGSISDKNNINTETNSESIKEDNKPEINTENSSSTKENELISKNEVSVISYFESYDNQITVPSNPDDRTLREKAKDAFVSIVDFIFYDKEIKGYTFNELTTSAKLKVIKLALSIDYKIDEYFPDYKEVIKDKYDNIKGKLAVKYLEFTSSLCEAVGEDTCNQAKEDFNSMKQSFNITWQLIKELASNGSTKVKEFYETWRDTK